jgi:NifU-like protein
MIQDLTQPFTWEKYNKRIRQKIASVKACGTFKPEESENRPLRQVTSESGALERGARVRLHLLVDTEDGIIVDARYEVFGPSALVAALEACVEIIVGKNYDQAHRLSSDVIDKHLREGKEAQSLPPEAHPYLGLLLDALDKATSQCTDIALSATYISSPLTDALKEGQILEDWPARSIEEKLAIVRQVVETEVRPYVEMDAGGVEVLRIQNENEVVIVYSGSCNGCFSSTGATLSGIQSILQAKIHPSLVVIPQL